MPPRTPRKPQLTDAERREILRRHAAGESRNSIVAATGRAAGTVSKTVADAGGSFARAPEIAAATEARVIDLASLRSQLALDYQLDAMKLRAQMWEPAVIFNFGGKDNDYNERHVDEPPAADKRTLMSASALAADRSLKLEPPKDEDGNAAIGSLLSGLFDRLQADHGSG